MTAVTMRSARLFSACAILLTSLHFCAAFEQPRLIDETEQRLEAFRHSPDLQPENGLDLDMGLNVGVRKVEEDSLPNLVLYRGTNVSEYCRFNESSPITENIVHQHVFNRSDGSLFVLHRHIAINSESCGTGQDRTGHMNIYPSNLLADAATATAANLLEVYTQLQNSPWASVVFAQIAESNAQRNINEPFFVGLDSEDRVCGGETRFPIGTLYLFIDTFLRFSVEGLGRIRRENGVTETGMGVFKPEAGVCLYKNNIESLEQAPSPSPNAGTLVADTDEVAEEEAKRLDPSAGKIQEKPKPEAIQSPASIPPTAPVVGVNGDGMTAVNITTPISMMIPGFLFADGKSRVVNTTILNLAVGCQAFMSVVNEQHPGSTLLFAGDESSLFTEDPVPGASVSTAPPSSTTPTPSTLSTSPIVSSTQSASPGQTALPPTTALTGTASESSTEPPQSEAEASTGTESFDVNTVTTAAAPQVLTTLSGSSPPPTSTASDESSTAPATTASDASTPPLVPTAADNSTLPPGTTASESSNPPPTTQLTPPTTLSPPTAQPPASSTIPASSIPGSSTDAEQFLVNVNEDDEPDSPTTPPPISVPSSTETSPATSAPPPTTVPADETSTLSPTEPSDPTTVAPTSIVVGSTGPISTTVESSTTVSDLATTEASRDLTFQSSSEAQTSADAGSTAQQTETAPTTPPPTTEPPSAGGSGQGTGTSPFDDFNLEGQV